MGDTLEYWPGSLPAPVGHEIVARVSELLLMSAIGDHRPDLSAPIDLALEDDVARIRRPAGKVVVP